MKAGKCRHCWRPIIWIRMTATGRLLPCNPGHDPHGNVSAWESVRGDLEGYVISHDRPAKQGARRFLAHHATCEKDPHRKPTPNLQDQLVSIPEENPYVRFRQTFRQAARRPGDQRP